MPGSRSSRILERVVSSSRLLVFSGWVVLENWSPSGMYDPNLEPSGPDPPPRRGIFRVCQGRKARMGGWRLTVRPAAGPSLPSPGLTFTP